MDGPHRTPKGRTESNLRGAIWPSLPYSITEHAARLKNRSMVGADGRTPTEMLRGGGVQRHVYDRGEMVLLLPLVLVSRKRLGCQVRLCRPFGVQIIW